MNRDNYIRHAIVLVDGSVLVEQADGSFRPETGQTDWDRVRRASDEEIAAAVAEDPDAAPVLSEEELASSEWTRPGAEPPSDAVLFDQTVLDWFRAKDGPAYQEHVNAVLRDYIRAQDKKAG